MDLDALHSALLSVSLVSDKLRLAREYFSEPVDSRPDLSRVLAEAEGDLRVAKATLAGELGFNLCPRCWPPELVTTDRQGRPTCPSCGLLSYEQAA
jgi:hypothetical protein